MYGTWVDAGRCFCDEWSARYLCWENSLRPAKADNAVLNAWTGGMFQIPHFANRRWPIPTLRMPIRMTACLPYCNKCRQWHAFSHFLLPLPCLQWAFSAAVFFFKYTVFWRAHCTRALMVECPITNCILYDSTLPLHGASPETESNVCPTVPLGSILSSVIRQLSQHAHSLILWPALVIPLYCLSIH